MRFTTSTIDEKKVITLQSVRNHDVDIEVDGQYVAFFDSKDNTLTVFPRRLKEHGLTLHVSE